MSYHPDYHRKRHAIRFGHRAIGPGVLAVWDGGGIRPLDDVCGVDWVVDYLSSIGSHPTALVVRGKDGWSLTKRKADYLWTKPVRLFKGSGESWSANETKTFFYLAKVGLIQMTIVKGGTIDGERK